MLVFGLRHTRFQARLDTRPAHGLAVLLIVRQGVGYPRGVGARGHRLFGLNVGFHFGNSFCVADTCFRDGGGRQMLRPFQRYFFWACGPGLFFKMVSFCPPGRGFSEMFFLGLRPALSRPPGILPPAGDFLLAQKVPPKRLPPVALRGFSPHLRPSWGFPLPRPSARVAGHCAKLGACQQCRLKPPRKICLTHNPPGAIRNGLEKHPSLAPLLGLSSSAPINEGHGTLCKTWSVSAVPFEATSENMPCSQPSWSHSKQPRKIPFTRNPLGAFLTCFPPARVAGHCAKLGGRQQQLLRPTACFQQAAI